MRSISIKQAVFFVCTYTPIKEVVLGAINQLMNNYGSELKTDVLIHSDQGCQYICSRFVTLLNDYGLRQSMSRRGNCWDNAPHESFFGHMKDEIRFNGSDGHNQVAKKGYGLDRILQQ